MKIALTIRNSTALLALSFLMQETHELAHTSVGRLICGCWGKRDFNVWGLCNDCAHEGPLTLLSTFAGPAYSFTVIWLGYWMLTRTSIKAKSAGFALVVSSMPFARVLTPILGGGDEIFALTRLGVDHSMAWAVTLIVVFALAVPPMAKIYAVIENRRKPLWILGLLLVPFLAVGAVVFGVLQALVLKNGILNDDWLLGSPIIVTAWLFFSAGVFAVFGKDIVTLLTMSPNHSRRPAPASERGSVQALA